MATVLLLSCMEGEPDRPGQTPDIEVGCLIVCKQGGRQITLSLPECPYTTV
jgi:hypothetical protein